MDYSNNACSAVEVAPRSEHHAAMLVLEQRAAQLAKSIDVLAKRMEPALRPLVPAPDCSTSAAQPSSSVQIIAHVDSVLRTIEGCIYQVDSLDGRLAI